MLIGVAIGILLPAAFVGLIYLVFVIGDKQPTMKLMGQLVFFGLALNILPARRLSKNNKEWTVRGLMLITMLMIVAWAIIFLLD